ncbi:MAG: zinc-dependent alcohol dehydrogenase family protein [Chloroflexi bacterium]|nr:zinc-dependent alcohol dehydrogenase family protein [Chloroflexota bacterium]
MKAQILEKTAPVEDRPLRLVSLPAPKPGPGEILVKVSVCGVCHTELDEIEGRLPARLPVIPGHEIIGTVAGQGKGAGRFKLNSRVGISWIHYACQTCALCREGYENLCAAFQGTGCLVHGGYAEYTVVQEDFACAVPKRFTDAQAAPLLCAGAIGFRALKLSEIRPGQNLGLFGFGASAHIVIQVARYWGCNVFVFTRSEAHRRLAEKLGALWTGGPSETPASSLDAALDFTPAGATVPMALRLLNRGARLVIAVIRKSDPIPPLDYTNLLWDEREIKSVANITRQDVIEFLSLADKIPIVPEVREFRLEDANEALSLLKQGGIQGAAVLRMG